MRHMAVLHGGRVVIGGQRMVGGIGPLSHHVVSTIAIWRLAHRWTHGRASRVPRVVQVLRSELRTALLRGHVAVVGP